MHPATINRKVALPTQAWGLLGVVLIGLLACLPEYTWAQATTDAAEAQAKDSQMFTKFISLIVMVFVILLALLIYAFVLSDQSHTFWRGEADKPLVKSWGFFNKGTSPNGASDAHVFEGGGASGSW